MTSRFKARDVEGAMALLVAATDPKGTKARLEEIANKMAGLDDQAKALDDRAKALKTDEGEVDKARNLLVRRSEDLTANEAALMAVKAAHDKEKASLVASMAARTAEQGELGRELQERLAKVIDREKESERISQDVAKRLAQVERREAAVAAQMAKLESVGFKLAS